MFGTEPRSSAIEAGRVRWLGAPTRPSQVAPSIVFHRDGGLGRSETFFLQGIIFDPGSAASAPASLTNGILVRPR